MIDKVYFYFLEANEPRAIVPFVESFKGLRVLLNGEEKQSYKGYGAVKRYLGTNLENEYGHLFYDPSFDASVWANHAGYIPYVLMSNIHDPIGVESVDKVLIVTGKSNVEDTHEIEIEAFDTNLHDLYIVIESKIIAEVLSNGQVRVTGR